MSSRAFPGRNTRCNARWALLLALLAGSCSPRQAAPSTLPSAAPPAAESFVAAMPQAVEPGRSRARSCKELGLLACDVAPSPEAELCSRVASCLIATKEQDDAAPVSDVTCSPLHDFAPAPAGTGLQKTAIVDIDGKMDEEEESSWRTDSTYLVAQTDLGFCLVDQLIVWDAVRDYSIETKFKTSWSADAQSAPELQLQVQHVGQTPTEGEPFVDFEFCYDDHYSLAGGRFKSVKKADREGRCTPELK